MKVYADYQVWSVLLLTSTHVIPVLDFIHVFFKAKKVVKYCFVYFVFN